MIPELPEIKSGFASCYPKFPNKIWVSGISGSGIPGSGFGLRVFCPALLTTGSTLGSYIVPTDQHEPFMRTLSPLMCTSENFPVGHPSKIAPSQARLTWRFFRDRLPKKMHLVGLSTLLIQLSLVPRYHNPPP
jgi:hypothetical protein